MPTREQVLMQAELTVHRVESAHPMVCRGDGAVVDTDEEVTAEGHGTIRSVTFHAPHGTHRIGDKILVQLDPTPLTIENWLAYGVAQGWVSNPHCATHDGIMNVGDEADRWEKGDDPCQTILRIL